MSPWRQVTHDPGTTEASPLPFSTAPTLERALSSSFFSSFPSFLASPRLAVTSRKKRAKQRRGPLDLLLSAFFFLPSLLLLSLSLPPPPRRRSCREAQHTTNNNSVRSDRRAREPCERAVFPGSGTKLVRKLVSARNSDSLSLLVFRSSVKVYSRERERENIFRRDKQEDGDEDGTVDTAAHTAHDGKDDASTVAHVQVVKIEPTLRSEVWRPATKFERGTEQRWLSDSVPQQLAEGCRVAGSQGLLPPNALRSPLSSSPSSSRPSSSSSECCPSSAPGPTSRLLSHKKAARPETEETVHMQILQQTVHQEL